MKMIRLVILFACVGACLNKNIVEESTRSPKLLASVSPITAYSDIAEEARSENATQLSTRHQSGHNPSAVPTTPSSSDNKSDDKDEDGSDELDTDSLEISLAQKRNVLPSSQTTTMTPERLVIRYQMECIEETRVDAEVVVTLKYHDWTIPSGQLQLVKDWALCVLMKSGIMTKEGVYKIDVALNRVPLSDRDRIEKRIDACLSSKAIPSGDIAFNYIKCYPTTKGSYSSIVSAF